jgi:hypothetical protein
MVVKMTYSKKKFKALTIFAIIGMAFVIGEAYGIIIHSEYITYIFTTGVVLCFFTCAGLSQSKWSDLNG